MTVTGAAGGGSSGGIHAAIVPRIATQKESSTRLEERFMAFPFEIGREIGQMRLADVACPLAVASTVPIGEAAHPLAPMSVSFLLQRFSEPWIARFHEKTAVGEAAGAA